MGSMYTAVLFLGIQNASSVQPIVSVERLVFYREMGAGMYSALPYAFAQVKRSKTHLQTSYVMNTVSLCSISLSLSQVMIELPYIFAQAVVYSVIVYSMIGFEWTVTKFFWYLFFMYITLLYFTYYGMMTVAVTPTLQLASIFSTAFYSIWNLFSGFMVPRTVCADYR